MNLEKIAELVGPVLEVEKTELVDLEFLQEHGRWVLRFYLDKGSGVTLADCEYLSDRIGAVLDSGDLMDRSYVLEVSSPGVDRPLKKGKDFERFSGRRVSVVLRRPSEGRRRFKGRLEGFSEPWVRVLVEGLERRFDLADIAEARLDAGAEVLQDLRRAAPSGKGGRRPFGDLGPLPQAPSGKGGRRPFGDLGPLPRAGDAG